MISISLCMIVKNEEDVLARCLESAKPLVDEIIVVDTGSDDKTKEIAKNCGAKVYDFSWIDDFSAARNFSFQQASKDYCMWLDADDVILPEDQKAFITLKTSLDPQVDIVMLPYHTAFDSQGKPTFSYYRERLLRRQANFRWEGAVHEAIARCGQVIYGEAAVTHRKVHPSDPDRNLRIFENQLRQGIVLGPREQFYYGRELYYHKRYQEAIEVYQKFLEEPAAWLENQIEACRQLSFCYYAMDKEKEALKALLHSLLYDKPRAEICCDIGKHFIERKRYEQAIFWYEMALTCPRNDTSGAFVLPDCYGYIPCIQLCVCYFHLGNITKAISYNEQAGLWKPQDPSYLYNKNYLAQYNGVSKA